MVGLRHLMGGLVPYTADLFRIGLTVGSNNTPFARYSLIVGYAAAVIAIELWISDNY